MTPARLREAVRVLTLVHLGLLALQSYANGRIDLVWTIDTNLFPLLVFFGIPAFALVLEDQQQERVALIALLGSLGAACVFQVQFHIIDQKIYAPVLEPTAWTTVFRIVVYALAVVDALGAIVVVRLIQRNAAAPAQK